jgi:hypothetical protein
MTTIELKKAHFERNAPRCKPHKLPPRLEWEGIHVILCGQGCQMHDGENLSPDALMLRWARENR